MNSGDFPELEGLEELCCYRLPAIREFFRETRELRG